MARRLLVVGSVLAAACASGGTGAGGPSTTRPTVSASPAAQPAKRPAVEVIRLGPSALRYVVHQRVHVEQDFAGLPPTLDLGFRIFCGATIAGPADSAGYPTTFSVDSILPDSGVTLPPTINLTAAKGLVFRGRLAPTGEFRNAVPSDSAVAQSLGQLLGRFRNFYPRLPAEGLKLGVAWTDTVSATDKGGGADVTTKSIIHSNAAAWEDRAGTRTLRLEVNSTFEFSGTGEGGGQPFQLAGGGARSGVEFVAQDGRYLGGESRDSTNLTITLPTQGVVIPRRQISRVTVTVLP